MHHLQIKALSYFAPKEKGAKWVTDSFAFEETVLGSSDYKEVSSTFFLWELGSRALEVKNQIEALSQFLKSPDPWMRDISDKCERLQKEIEALQIKYDVRHYCLTPQELSRFEALEAGVLLHWGPDVEKERAKLAPNSLAAEAATFAYRMLHGLPKIVHGLP